MNKSNIKIIFELIIDENGSKHYFQISEESNNVKEVHNLLNVKNMNNEDIIFYNKSINGRKKDSIYSICKEYLLMNSKCAKEIEIALLQRDKEWEQKNLERDKEIKLLKEKNSERDKEWEQKNLERDKEIESLKEKINKLSNNDIEM